MASATITVNGQPVSLADVPTHTTVLDFLRERGLTGCKEGCAEGECGACSVLVARPGIASPAEWIAVNACLAPAAALDGQEIVTAEGLGTPNALHPVQREMAVRGGSQCGYCTPGFVCSMAAEYYRPGRAGASEHGAGRQGASQHGADHNGDGQPGAHERGPNGFDLHALSGNLCRCTGYRPIRDAAYALGDPPPGDLLAERLRRPAPGPAATRLEAQGRRFTRPASLAEALRQLRDEPDTAIIAGCTDWGVEVNLRGARAERVMAVDRLPELCGVTVTGDEVEIGAAATLTEIERRLDGRVPLLDQMFPQFASRLIRNAATTGGNLGTGSPIGDTPPALLALEASVVLAAADGERVVPLDSYFTGYRRSVRRPGELIRAVRIPLPLARLTAFHKIAKRRFDDISSIAVGFAIDIEAGVIRAARIGLGGVAATPVRAYATETALEGRAWSPETVRAAAAVLRDEGTPLDDHRASAAYRVAMLGQSLLKLYADHTVHSNTGHSNTGEVPA
jgi:xanthine dehydrogenase small subunit